MKHRKMVNQILRGSKEINIANLYLPYNSPRQNIDSLSEDQVHSKAENSQYMTEKENCYLF